MELIKSDIKILFICKASVKEGLGHLYRAGSLAQSFVEHGFKISFVYISEDNLGSNISLDAPIIKLSNEDEVLINQNFDICILDLLHLSLPTFKKLKTNSKLLVSISPIFNHMDQIDILFHRTKYLDLSQTKQPKKIYNSLEYCIIKNNCVKINTDLYSANLQKKNLSIAISMGGTDPHNLTHKVIRALADLNTTIQLWVILGQGYKYSYDDLVTNANKNDKHEIILIKSNKSLWEIMQNCSLCILIGGITAYEAAYVGLPSIIIHPNQKRKYLVQELFDTNHAIDGGQINDNLNTLKQVLESLISDKKRLASMHQASKNLFKSKADDKIIDICLNELSLITQT